ncbi:MAG TPA: ABC transporter ATP-binding protein [Streptosporangiaceae bacterium]|nr:ABC transporter ATP-binding protein [Streptosporangiaceae bacterium]
MSAARPAPAGTPAQIPASQEDGQSAAADTGPDEAPSPPGPSGLAITTSGLTKRFRGGQVAVDDLALAVPRGSVYGFLGPNGSGKTTTIRMLLGLIYPTRGSVCLLGDAAPGAAARVLPRVGSLVEGPAFYPGLSGRANLTRIDAADRTADPGSAPARIDAALDRVGLLSAARKRYRAYSLGMKQRLAIATSLLRPRELIILDEPTNGLDPQGTREVRGLIREIATDGVTVLISSHLLAEVEQICTHVGVMRTGRLVFQGSLEEMRGLDSRRVVVRTAQPGQAAKVLAALGLADIQSADGEVSAQLADESAERICRELVLAGVGVAGLDTPRPNLEDLFVGLTGEGFDVDG